MHDDYDFTATFDFDDSEWKAIDDALALLEEKFAMLDEPVEEAEEGCWRRMRRSSERGERDRDREPEEVREGEREEEAEEEKRI